MIKTRENAKRRTTTNKCDALPTEKKETHSWWKLFLDYLDFCHLENKSLFHSPKEYRSACAARDRARRALAGVGWWVERAPFSYWIISFINQTIVAQTRRPMLCTRLKDGERKIKISARSYSDSLGNVSKLDASTIFLQSKNLLHWPHSVAVAYQIYSHFLFIFSCRRYVYVSGSHRDTQIPFTLLSHLFHKFCVFFFRLSSATFSSIWQICCQFITQSNRASFVCLCWLIEFSIKTIFLFCRGHAVDKSG